MDKPFEVKEFDTIICNEDYKDDEMEQLYTSLHEERQTLITPVEPAWNQIVEKWYGEEYQKKRV